MKLYSFTGSCALASHIVLEWTGQSYELELIQREDLDNPELLRRNPNHKVPVLEEDGWVLTENAAILTYLADRHPEAGLDGSNIKERAEVSRWLGLINSEVHPAFKPLFGATAYLQDETLIEQTKSHARKLLRTHFERIDQQLDGRDYLTGTRSIADAYLFITVLWTDFVGVDVSGLDNLARFKRAMLADEGVQKAMQAQGLG